MYDPSIPSGYDKYIFILSLWKLTEKVVVRNSYQVSESTEIEDSKFLENGHFRDIMCNETCGWTQLTKLERWTDQVFILDRPSAKEGDVQILRHQKRGCVALHANLNSCRVRRTMSRYVIEKSTLFWWSNIWTFSIMCVEKHSYRWSGEIGRNVEKVLEGFQRFVWSIDLF